MSENAPSADYAWASDMRGLARIRSTDVPGLVLCEYRKSGKRPQCYVVTHEASGRALTQTFKNAAGPRHLKVAERIVRALGDLRYRRRPVDWTRPMDELRDIPIVSRTLSTVNGWLVLTDKRSLEDQQRDIDEFRASVGLPPITRASRFDG